MNPSTMPVGGVRWLCLGAAIVLGLSVSCSEKKPPASVRSQVPTTIDGNDPRPHLVTIAFQNRGEGPTTAHYTYNGREMETYSEGLRNVVRELRSAEEPYVLILHEPGYSIADAGGDEDDLNAEFAQALVGKRVLQYELDSDVEPLVIYIAIAHDKQGIYELNGKRATRSDVSNALGQQPNKNGMIVAVQQGRYWLAEYHLIRPVSRVVGDIDEYMRAYGIVRWLSLQDSVEWESE